MKEAFKEKLMVVGDLILHIYNVITSERSKRLWSGRGVDGDACAVSGRQLSRLRGTSRRFSEVPSTKVGDDQSFMNSSPFLLSSRLIGLSLLFFGYLIAVTGVDNGKKELELLRMETNMNMIITDYWMLEMIGYELLKRIKESSKLKENPMIIMSSKNVPNRIYII
ncbi:hypothetical protein ZIOFF_059521 [Zingiber officinale]|uniref:Response regulatory domain-containing protein n=1 Tax=Zingiber officinale TaxID=94328 RepID=A0A8J5KKC7_ZINOF|nr:hypothetical protein ZIOFF_059521 [Zingiber officinale]